MTPITEIISLSEQDIKNLLAIKEEKTWFKKIIGIKNNNNQIDLYSPGTMKAISENLIKKPIALQKQFASEIRHEINRMNDILIDIEANIAMITGDFSYEVANYARIQANEYFEEHFQDRYRVDVPEGFLLEGENYSDMPFLPNEILKTLKTKYPCKLKGEFGSVYQAQLDELKLLDKEAKAQIEVLKNQLNEINNVINPILKMSKDIKEYIQVCERTDSIQKIVNSINQTNDKIESRKLMINTLATYSQNAVMVLEEVKELINASAKARLEIKTIA